MISLKVFSMAYSTASSKQNFSNFGYVHSKGQNKLSKDRVQKLVYLKSNAFYMSKKKIYFYEEMSNKEEQTSIISV